MTQPINSTLTPLFREQTKSVYIDLDYLVSDVSRDLWLTRLAPGQNLFGFIAWHIPSIHDFILNSLIRGVPEVRTQARWQNSPNLDTTTISFGMSLAEADQTAIDSSAIELVAYGQAVCECALQWLETADEATLQAIPAGRQNLARPTQYHNVQFHDDINGVLDAPTWSLLTGTCYGHLFSHMGELVTMRRQAQSKENER